MSNKSLKSMLSEYQDASMKFNEYYTELCLASRQKYPEALRDLAELRHLKVETLEKLNICYVGEYAEMLNPKYEPLLKAFGVISPDNNKPVFHNRWLIPIYGIDGALLNLVGYSNKEEVRYVYGTGRWYERGTDLYGIDNAQEIFEKGWCYVVEGFMDAIALINLGVTNVVANCGTRLDDTKKDFFNLLNAVAVIYDRDSAGDQSRKNWTYGLSCARVDIQLLAGCKDIDDYVDKCDADIKQIRQDTVRQMTEMISDWVQKNTINIHKVKLSTVLTTEFILA